VKALSIRVTAEAPLAIRADHAPEGAKGADFIPGTTLVGALAATYRQLNSTQTDEFERLFLREQVFYPNLYPATFKHEDDEMQDLQDADNLPIYPLPKTAQSCKRHEGFRFPEDKEEKAHGVHDSLIDWALARLDRIEGYSYRSGNPLAALKKYTACPICKEAMDHFTGYYRRQDSEPHNMIRAKINKRLRTHTGIDRETGTVEEGILYNREVFEEEMLFWGSIQFPDDDQLIASFRTFINKVGHAGLVRIGTGRTRGMGQVTLDVARLDKKDHFASFKDRLQQLNERLRGQAKCFELSALPDSTFFFALTLHSPLILCDELLRYRGTIDEKALQDLLGSDHQIPGLKRIYQAASVSRVTGWQEMWGLPRTNEYAIDTGSVFLFTCPQPPDEPILERLRELEEQGIGKRRVEGFGRICISDQFHQEIGLR
jgi:CRISPR-associated protein Csx10